MSRDSASSWVLARNSAIHGRGLYARQRIPEGTRVIEYLGERITKAESVRREALRLERLRRGRSGCVYIFNLNKRHDIDGSAAPNLARLINHSCEPNCRSEIIRGRIWIIAKKEIAEGEELSFDYGYPLGEWRNHPCRCGAPTCPGFIVAKAQRKRLRRAVRVEQKKERAGGVP